jgi:tetratricopeptide (TPR) repeat protein
LTWPIGVRIVFAIASERSLGKHGIFCSLQLRATDMSIRVPFSVVVLAGVLPIATAQTSSDEQASRIAAAGQQAMIQGDYTLARQSFEQLAKLEPGVAEVHATLAAICFKGRDYDCAIHEVRAAQRLKPALPKLDALLGASLAEESRYADALPHLEKSFHQEQDPAVRRMAGLELLRAYSELGRDPESVETALTLNKLYPDDPEVLYHTGRIYGAYAYNIMERLHDTAPNSIWMLQAQGEANESEKNWDAAIAAFTHVLALDPTRPRIHYQLGRIYLTRYRDSQDARDRDGALRELGAELTIDPHNGNARYELANLQTDLGNLDEARGQYEQALASFPDFEEALVGLAGVEITQQKPAEAIPLLQHATRLRSDDEVAWWRLARAERAVGNAEGQAKALAEFQRLHRITPVTLRSSSTVDAVTPQQLDAGAKP